MTFGFVAFLFFASQGWAAQNTCLLALKTLKDNFVSHSAISQKQRDHLETVLQRATEKPEILADYYFFDSGGSLMMGGMLVANDAFVDPSFHQWMQTAKQISQTGRSPLEAAEDLAKLTNHSFSETRVSKNPIHTARKDQLQVGDNPVMGLLKGAVTRKLGDFIDLGYGVCRHETAALFMALRQFGIDAEHTSGEFDVVNENGEVLSDGEHHAWIEFTFNGRRYLLDSTNEVVTPVELTNANGAPFTMRFRHSRAGLSVFTYKKEKAKDYWHPLRAEDLKSIRR